MASGRKRILLSVIVAVFAALYAVYGLAGPGAAARDKSRPDVIRLDVLASYGSLEKPAPLFLHDLHTAALSKKGKDCSACHLPLPGGKGYSTRFFRMDDKGKKRVMGIYHDKCVACHKETARAGEKSGPVACGDCHAKAPAATLSRLPMSLDRSLHFRHTRALKDKCELCHHSYDAKAKKLFYVKGKEESCRSCHGVKTVDNAVSYPEAAHTACIRCHRETAKKGVKAGPVNCAGCHGARERRAVAVVPNAPRIARHQPDSVLMTAPVKPGDTIPARMAPVAFMHREHELDTDSCRRCHHEDLSPCAKCHTLSGSPDGKSVNLERAMHDPASGKSCIGCHNTKQKAAACVGCHARLPRSPGKDSGCVACHAELPANLAAMPDKAAAARMMDEARKRFTGTYADQDVPEKVTIGTLSGKDSRFQPSQMPHRRMVRALEKGMKADRLSAAFHTDPGTLCQGCHHQSPPSKTPPKCSSCHARIPGEEKDGKPGLVAAYHNQCLGCHRDMGVKDAVGCTDCHKEAKK